MLRIYSCTIKWAGIAIKKIIWLRVKPYLNCFYPKSNKCIIAADNRRPVSSERPRGFFCAGSAMIAPEFCSHCGHCSVGAVTPLDI